MAQVENCDFAAYREKAKTTAVFPQEVADFYLYHGLVGELGEFSNKWKKVLRGDVGWSPQIQETLLDELGDISWYLAVYGINRKVQIEDICLLSTDFSNKKNEWQYDELAHKIMKFLVTQREAPLAVRWKYEVAVRQVGVVAHLLGSTFQEVLDNNLKKLADRKERNVLKGSGDNR